MAGELPPMRDCDGKTAMSVAGRLAAFGGVSASAEDQVASMVAMQIDIGTALPVVVLFATREECDQVIARLARSRDRVFGVK